MNIQAVLFDFDGTITQPGHLDFNAIREAIGCPRETSILDYINALSGKDKKRAEQVLDDFEMSAAANALPAEGLAETLQFFAGLNVKLGILTRNTRRAFSRSLLNIPFCSESSFSSVITRDDDLPVKPAPDGVIETSKRIGTDPDRMLVVGDYIYDIEAGTRAGSKTVFIDAVPERAFAAPNADHVFSDLRSLIFLPYFRENTR